MSQLFKLNVNRSLLSAQRNELSKIVWTLSSDRTVTIGPDDKAIVSALAGIENLLDALSDQSDAPEQPDQPDPHEMGRAEFKDFYHHNTGDTLDEVFGSPDWDTFDGQEFVASHLND